MSKPGRAAASESGRGWGPDDGDAAEILPALPPIPRSAAPGVGGFGCLSCQASSPDPLRPHVTSKDFLPSPDCAFEHSVHCRGSSRDR